MVGTATSVGAGAGRLVRAWRRLPHESRLAAYASLLLFVALFLPWYQVTVIARARSSALQSASATITGWGAFSFVEAAVLLVAAGVLILLFQRAEGRAFHLPGGDGGVITAAGLWTCLLIVWRIFDKQGASTHGPSATTSGVEWGIFVALAAAALLAYSGSRIRAAHRPEPPLPGEPAAPARRGAAAGSDAPTAPRPVPADGPGFVGDSGATTARPRRRVPRSELFERVEPDDPPTVPFGRLPRAGEATTGSIPPPDRAPGDPQLEIPFDANDTAVLGGDDTAVLGGDETLALGADETIPFARDDTAPSAGSYSRAARRASVPATRASTSGPWWTT